MHRVCLLSVKSFAWSDLKLYFVCSGDYSIIIHFVLSSWAIFPNGSLSSNVVVWWLWVITSVEKVISFTITIHDNLLGLTIFNIDQESTGEQQLQAGRPQKGEVNGCTMPQQATHTWLWPVWQVFIQLVTVFSYWRHSWGFCSLASWHPGQI